MLLDCLKLVLNGTFLSPNAIFRQDNHIIKFGDESSSGSGPISTSHEFQSNELIR